MEEKLFTLSTPYSDNMDRDMPWCVYPRPILKRDSFLCLNGSWDFKICTSPLPSSEYNEKILVPFPPESALSGIERSVGEGAFMHYRRFFVFPEGFIKDRIILHFGAVDQICEPYINGHRLEKHEGGYSSFSYDITDYIRKDGENELAVIAKDDLSVIYPYGKQSKNRGGMWYTPVSGIWQTVWIESVCEGYIQDIRITPSMKSVKIELKGGEGLKRLTLSDSAEAYEFSGDGIVIEPKEIRLWSPENPHLYRFTIEVGEDKIESYFALREIGIEKVLGIPRLTLNGSPYVFHGLLDQGYFPDGIFLPATAEGYERDIRLAKSLGFNMLRKHIKVEPDIFYYLCDKLGIAVFQDMVNNSKYSFLRDTALPTVAFKRLPDRFSHRNKKSRRMFELGMKETMEQLYSFPSILYYTVFNEGWGQFSADEMYERAKSIDSTRIIDSTSGWFVRQKSDVDSRHVYFKRLKPLKISERPLVISEFGGYSHRVEGHLFGRGNYGYKSFDSQRDYENAVHRLYTDEVLPLVRCGASAFVYTQLSDVEDETNGLITYDRRVVKVDGASFCELGDIITKSEK